MTITRHALTEPEAAHRWQARALAERTAPMDGMWEAFARAGTQVELRRGATPVACYAVHGPGALLQFVVDPAQLASARRLFVHAVADERVSHAVVGTNDPHLLLLCLDHQRGVAVQTFLYQLDQVLAPDAAHAGAELRAARAHELARIVDFQRQCLVSADDPSDFLRAYSGRLIERGELFVLSRGGAWLGLGERRRSDTQRGVADLGVMVAPEQRARGLGTDILRRLVGQCRDLGLAPICSTTVDNVGSQRAIARAGFVSRHRMVRVAFTVDAV